MQEADGAGVIPDAVVLTPSASGPRLAPELDQAGHNVQPQEVSPAGVIFFNDAFEKSTCPGKVRKREYEPRTRKT